MENHPVIRETKGAEINQGKENMAEVSFMIID